MVRFIGNVLLDTSMMASTKHKRALLLPVTLAVFVLQRAILLAEVG
jgi:hypothetical protein